MSVDLQIEMRRQDGAVKHVIYPKADLDTVPTIYVELVAFSTAKGWKPDWRSMRVAGRPV